MKLLLSEAATSDLESIGRFIAEDNPDRAILFLQEILACCTELLDMPRAFPVLRGFEKQGLRRRRFGNYLLVYAVSKDRVEIVRILHGARDIPATLLSGG